MGALEAHGSRYGKVGGWGRSGVTIVGCAGGWRSSFRSAFSKLGFPGRVPWRGDMRDTHAVYLLFAKAYKTRMGPEVVSLGVSSRVL